MSITEVQDTQTAAQETAVFDQSNPFFAPSALPYSAPPFDLIREEHYMPAFEAGMAENRAEVDAIIASPEAPSFENTLVALEKSGALLSRVATAFYAVAGAHTSPTIQQMQQDVAPKLSAHSDAINLDARLFARVRSLYEQRGALDLDVESLRLLEITYDGFVKSGALLNEGDKEKLKALNTEQSTLQAKFINRVLAAMKEGGLQVPTREALDGLQDAEINEAAEAAKARELDGFYLSLQNTTQQPALASLTNRETRKLLWEASLTRAEQGNDRDTREMIARLAQLRAQRASLLGYESYAAWKLSDQMARTPAAAVKFLDHLVPAALAGAKAEAAAMQSLIDASGSSFELAPWDWAFYAEQVRKEKYDINEDEVKQYFELNRVFEDGVLFAATQLYGITFRKRADLPVYHPDVVTYEVFNADGSHLALLYCDFYRRDSKRGGAWMSSLLTQSKLLGDAPIITNVCNYTKPVNGEPSLVDSDEVQTLFHEFGHALHGLFSEATYPSLSGTAVPRDFVEFPSQFNEHWASYPAIFNNYAKHWQTGETMPAELQAKLKATKNFNGGHALTEVLAAAELDMQWHTLPAAAELQDSSAFEAAALERAGVAVPLVPPRYRSTYFSHIFGGGYASGYYAYLWAEMLDSDAYHWFEQNGGMTRANGDRLRNMVLSRGNTADPAELYRAWAGRDPVIGPMLQQRGIPDSAVGA
jgi:peptidyl-dipeptidase Dcp